MKEVLIKIAQGIVGAVILAALSPLAKEFAPYAYSGLSDFIQGLLVPRDVSEDILRTRLHILHVFEFLGIVASFGIGLLLYTNEDLTWEHFLRIGVYCGIALVCWIVIFIATITFLLGVKPLIPIAAAMTFLIFMDLLLLYCLVQESGGPLGSIFSPFYPALPLLTIQFANFPLLYALLLPFATMVLFGFSLWQLHLPVPRTIGHTITMAIPIFLGSFISFYNQS